MIKTFDYLLSLSQIEDEVRDAVNRVLRSGNLILGSETEAFESEFARFVGARHCIGVSSGTTALHLALAALDVGPGAEVVTVANTCAPTVAAIRQCGAEPVFADVRNEDLLIDVEHVRSLLSDRTRCLLPVHLWGNAANLDELLELSRGHGIPIVEDCAQAHGTTWRGRTVGTFGAAGCFSFYPTKNLGAYGDAGAVVTDDDSLARRLRRIRTYGYDGSPVSVEEGFNGRINEIQSAILRVKLKVYPSWLERRLTVAAVYDSEIDFTELSRPAIALQCEPTYHQYVVRSRDRDGLATALYAEGIQTGIHYPVPVHRMPAYDSLPGAREPLPVTERACREILSLPIHEGLAPEQARTVSEAVNRFEARREEIS